MTEAPDRIWAWPKRLAPSSPRSRRPKMDDSFLREMFPRDTPRVENKPTVYPLHLRSVTTGEIIQWMPSYPGEEPPF